MKDGIFDKPKKPERSLRAIYALWIFEILWRESDAGHPLSLRELRKHLQDERGILCMGERLDTPAGEESPRSAYRAVNSLVRDLLLVHGEPAPRSSCLHASRVAQKVDPLPLPAGARLVYRLDDTKVTGREVVKNLYLEHPLAPSELRMLADGLMFSYQLGDADRKALLAKLRALGGEHFNHLRGNVRAGESLLPQAPQLTRSLEQIDRALTDRLQLEFTMGRRDVTGGLRPVPPAPGRELRQLIEPEALIACGGNYYLVYAYAPAPGTEARADARRCHVRVARMLDVAATDRPCRIRQADKLRLPRYPLEHAFMAYDEPEYVRFRILERALDQVFDTFGMPGRHAMDVSAPVHIRYVAGDDPGHEKDPRVEVEVRTSPWAMERWALMHAEDVEITYPQALREEMARLGRVLASRYAGESH